MDLDFNLLITIGVIIPVVTVPLYFFLKLWYGYRKEQLKDQKKDQRNKAEQDLETQLNDLIDNAPRLKSELDRQIADQRSKGVTDQQMSGMLMYKQIVDLAASNPQFAQIIGKPLVKGIVGIVAKIPKIISGLTSI